MTSVPLVWNVLVLFSTIYALQTGSMALTLRTKRFGNKCSKMKPKINSRSRTTAKKRKYASDGLDVLESFAVLEGNPRDVHTLILGTLPSDKSYGNNLSSKEILLRGGEGHQNYGHSRNSFWNIVGSAFGFLRHQTPYEEQVRLLTDEGYSVWDVLSEAKRKGSLDSNLVKGSLNPTDLPKFILDHPNLNRFVFAANSAEVFCKKDVWADWLTTGESKPKRATNLTQTTENLGGQSCDETVKTKFWIRGRSLNPETFARTNAIFGKKKGVEIVDEPSLSRSYAKFTTVNNVGVGSDGNDDTRRRVIELIVVPSTSPANARLRPPEKEKLWHMACYRLQEPPPHYRCPGCEHHRGTEAVLKSSSDDSGKHWFHDCPHRNDWNQFKKRQTKTIDDAIDPFYWYR